MIVLDEEAIEAPEESSDVFFGVASFVFEDEEEDDAILFESVAEDPGDASATFGGEGILVITVLDGAVDLGFGKFGDEFVDLETELDLGGFEFPGFSTNSENREGAVAGTEKLEG